MNSDLLARINVLSGTFDHAAAVRIAELEEEYKLAMQSLTVLNTIVNDAQSKRKNTGVKQPFVRRPLCRICHRRNVDYALTGKCENCSQNDG